MIRLIELTYAEGKKEVFINIEEIVCFHKIKFGSIGLICTCVRLTDGEVYYVSEIPQEIIDKINDLDKYAVG